jgi:hypothetical protein
LHLTGESVASLPHLQVAAIKTMMSSGMFPHVRDAGDPYLYLGARLLIRPTALTLSPPACYKEKDSVFPSQPGPVAQLGARMTGSHEVEGSNPSRSTIHFSQKITRCGLAQVACCVYCLVCVGWEWRSTDGGRGTWVGFKITSSRILNRRAKRSRTLTPPPAIPGSVLSGCRNGDWQWHGKGAKSDGRKQQ